MAAYRRWRAALDLFLERVLEASSALADLDARHSKIDAKIVANTPLIGGMHITTLRPSVVPGLLSYLDALEEEAPVESVRTTSGGGVAVLREGGDWTAFGELECPDVDSAVALLA